MCYYQVEVNRELLQEYIDISHTPKTQHGAIVIQKRKEEIRQHIAFEAIAAFAAEFAPEEPVLEVVK